MPNVLSAAVPPRRFRVVGCSGAGKTTFAAALADRLGIGHLELDEVFWAERWTKRDPDEGRARIRAFLASTGADGWVVDGNWDTARDGLLDDVLDAYVWLDYSRTVVMRRVVARTLCRAVTGQELWHGNRERPRNPLSRDLERNIVLWAWRMHGPYRKRYAALADADPAGGEAAHSEAGRAMAAYRSMTQAVPLVGCGSEACDQRRSAC